MLTDILPPFLIWLDEVALPKARAALDAVQELVDGWRELAEELAADYDPIPALARKD